MKKKFLGSNGSSKSPSFHTEFKNVHMTFVKNASKKVFALRPKKIGFLGITFLGALFTEAIGTFLKSVGMKRRFFDTLFDLIKEKKCSSHSRVNEYFL